MDKGGEGRGGKGGEGKGHPCVEERRKGMKRLFHISIGVKTPFFYMKASGVYLANRNKESIFKSFHYDFGKGREGKGKGRGGKGKGRGREKGKYSHIDRQYADS